MKPRPFLLTTAILGGAVLYLALRSEAAGVPSRSDTEPAAERSLEPSPATGPAGAPPTASPPSSTQDVPPTRTTWVEPAVMSVDFRLRGRVEVGAERRASIQVWLIEFGEDPDFGPFDHSPQQRFLDDLDDVKFDLARLKPRLVGPVELVATATPDSDGTFAITLPRNVNTSFARLVALDQELGECTPLCTLTFPETVLTFPPPSDLDVVVTHDLGGANLTVEAVDVMRRYRKAHSAPLENGIARFAALPRSHWVFCVRSDDPPLYCATKPIDTSNHRFALHLDVRTRAAACTSDLHDEERGGTISPLVEASVSGGRMPGTERLRLGTRCPRCALLSKGTYDFDRETPKYSFGSFPVPQLVQKDGDVVHVWDEDGVTQFAPSAWIEVR